MKIHLMQLDALQVVSRLPLQLFFMFLSPSHLHFLCVERPFIWF